MAEPRTGTDVLRWPLIGRFLRWPGSRVAMQIPLFAIAALMVWHGLTGPQTGARNLATVLTWVHYRGALVLILLLAGNLFCMACPFMLPRTLARKVSAPVRAWPAPLRNKWLAVGTLIAVLFVYERFDLWDSPWWTAWLIIGYFAGATLVDAFFRNAPFCKYVCPLGQFNFTASTVSPLELGISNPAVCASCETRDCIKGTPDPDHPSELRRRGCELSLFQPEKRGNLDCTLCLDCVYACPHDNIGLRARLPASELWDDRRRSGVGLIGRRPDLAALVLVFTFGALLNAFGMVSPIHAARAWVGGALGTTSETAILGTMFTVGLVVEPILLLLGAGWLTRRLVRGGEDTGSSEALLPLVTRFAYALVPLGLGVWVAHHSFHLLSGLWTVIPVTQDALASAGLPSGGAPLWHLRGLPSGWVLPAEYLLLSLGIVGSLLVGYRIAERDFPRRTARAYAPWAALIALLGIVGLWLLSQPMEMRGMMVG